MHIRNVTAADTKAITDIYNRYVTDSVVTFETKPLTEADMLHRIKETSAHHPYFVCEDNGNVAGYCYAHPWKERAAYSHTLETTVYISPKYHRMGIAQRLMDRLIDECRSRGYHALIACITGDNEASISLHRKLGFKQVSLFKEVGMKFGRWLDVTDYELVIEAEQ